MNSEDPEMSTWTDEDNLVETIVFCIVAGGQMSILWRVLTTEYERDTHVAKCPRWKSDILRAIVVTQAYWSEESARLDDPLRSYIRAERMNRISNRVAWSWLFGVLISKRYNINDKLSDNPDKPHLNNDD
jgi:hypothetical protein